MREPGERSWGELSQPYNKHTRRNVKRIQTVQGDWKIPEVIRGRRGGWELKKKNTLYRNERSLGQEILQ